jgi:U3 small nucleolar RNA-associated protein 20
MGEDRLEQHIKQVVLNIKYEFQEGRMSAISLAAMVVEKIPAPVLEKYANLFFLPLVLQMVNDDSKECREAVAKCLSLLLSRCSTDLLQSFYEYTLRWSKNPGPLRITSLQLFGIFVESREDFFRKGDAATSLVARLEELLKTDQSEWEIPYFSLICIEKLSKSFSQIVVQQMDLWITIIELLVHPHPWIKVSSSRLVNSQLLVTNTKSFDGKSTPTTVLVDKPGSLFKIARNLCFQLNVEEGEQTDEHSQLAIKSLTWILPVMREHPHLCFANDDTEKDERDPVSWLLTRLSNIAKPKGSKRRGAIFKCFAAFVTYHGSIVSPFLDLMLEPLHRANTEVTNEIENPFVAHKRNQISEAVSADASLARDVLQLLEESCGSTEEFLRAYASVKTRARDKKDQRKTAAKTEAVLDPQGAAKRKVEKQDREKKRQKRRVEDRRRGRGAEAKRRNVSG